MITIAAIGALVLGLITCFAGYALIRFLLGLLGFAAGALVGSVVSGLFLTDPAPWVYPVSILAGGLAGAILAQVFFLAGVFVVGASFGALVGGVLAARFGFEPAVGVVVAALAGGVLALGLQRLLIALSTAFIGAWLVMSGLFVVLGLEPVLIMPGGILDQIARGGQTTFLLAWAGVGALGFAAQMRTRPKPEPPDRKRKD